MNRTDTLLRLKRFKVDEMKRRVASIEAMRADLDRKLADLDENVAREKQRAGEPDDDRAIVRPTLPMAHLARREMLEILKAERAEHERKRAAARQHGDPVRVQAILPMKVL